jgi:D-3-phosphoglycerate dehydrogenase
MSFKVVLTSRVLPRKVAENFQEKLGAEFVTIPCTTEDEITAAAGDADAVVTLMQPYTRRVIEKLAKLRLIYNAGTGFDTIDLETATEMGVCVAYPGNYCTDEVAEHAIALMLASARKITRLDRAVRKGQWGSFEKREIRNVILPSTFRLKGQTAGIIGLGRIGQAAAARALGLGLKVIAFDPYVDPEVFAKAGVASVTLEQLLKEADFVMILAALSPGSEHMIGADQLGLMKPTAYIVNAGRGAYIDQQALYAALAEGRIAGAALDVVEEEPEGIGGDHPLLTLDNVIITAHSAYFSEESSEKYRWRIYEAVASIMNNEWPEWLANPDVRDNYKKRWG